MAFYISTTQLPLRKVLPLIIMLFFFVLPSANSIYFNYSNFRANDPREIEYIPDATPFVEAINLNEDVIDLGLNGSTGRAIYKDSVRIWDSETGSLTDFKTRFSLKISSDSNVSVGDGLTFFLSRNGSTIESYGSRGNLGIYSDSDFSENQFVAIEFDTYPDAWDPGSAHVGININSRESNATSKLLWNTSSTDVTASALVRYSANTKNLSVFLSYDEFPVFGEEPDLSCTVDLRQILPEWVNVGFSAATGEIVEEHDIVSWEFNSTLEISQSVAVPPPQTIEGGVNSTRQVSSDGLNPTQGIGNGKEPKKIGLIAGLVLGGAVLSAGLVGLIIFGLKVKRDRTRKEGGVAFDLEMDDEFEKGTGPKRFSYSELVLATRNFSEDGKLGEGGFGGVYKGFLTELNLHVAVKRVSRDSTQGRKEYASEVKTISRLRHRNLVQLLGWCHEHGDFLLVYEFMPNGSLDSHLFHGKRLLGWAARYKIATGLASALLYLHEEWEQCVVHRDVKSSNVMLDSNFNAKLGDFGLARLVDHEHGLQTTVIAGTMGYLAPECVTTGKASKEADVYSFGVVALEIACGRRPVEPKAEAGKVMMVEWVWELYGRGLLLDAVDERLEKEFDEAQIERLMVLGLWCAHPDYNVRPSMRQVISVLNLEAPLRSLPSKMPVPVYFSPPMNPSSFSYASSAYATNNSSRGRSQGSDSSHTTSSNVTPFLTSSTGALLR